MPVQTLAISNYLQNNNKNVLSDNLFHDFYASTEHCIMRQKKCQAKFNLETINIINNADKSSLNKINVVAYQIEKSVKNIRKN